MNYSQNFLTYIYIFGKVSKIKNFDEELWTQ